MSSFFIPLSSIQAMALFASSYKPISTGSLKKNISTIGHIYYQDKKSKLIIGKNLKKFKKSSDGIFDSYLFKIK
ncbi:hypothetical protein N9T31_00445 [Alphaproteobacteria bacterium]|nr:hypothetical protein [Alphaproteobacteria bacterium]